MKKVLVGVVVLLSIAVIQSKAVSVEVLSRFAYGPAYSVEYSDPYLYLSAGNSLIVLDISNPDTPSVVSEVRFEGLQALGYGIKIKGNYLYAALYDYGYGIVDISDPTAPQIVYMEPYPMRMLAADVSGDYMYVAAVDSGLVVIDVSDPLAPNIVRTVPTSAEATKPFVIDTLLFVAAAGGGVDVFSIADPASPQFITNLYSSGGDVFSVFVRDTLAFLAAGRAGILIFNIADLSSPSLIGTYDTRGSAYDVKVIDTLLYYADWSKGVGILNIADPTNPTYITGFDTDGYARWIEIVGDRLYDAEKKGGLKIFDISDPSSFALSGSFFTGNWVWCVASYDREVFVSGWATGLEKYDVSDFSNPQLVQRNEGLLSHSMAMDVEADENYVYVCGGRDGFLIIDKNDLFNIIGASSISSAYAVELKDTLAFVALSTSGVAILNLADPTTPQIVTQFNTNQFAYELQLVDTLLYVADKRAGLSIYNVADPTNPVLVSNVALSDSDNVYDILVNDTIGYAADYNRGTPIINLADPTAPFVITTIPAIYKVRDVDLIGNYLFVSEEDSGVYVYDVSDPASPVYATKILTADVVWKIRRMEDTLLIFAARGSGVYIVHPILFNINENDGDRHAEGIMIVPSMVNDGRVIVKLYTPEPTNVELSLYNEAGRLLKRWHSNGMIASGEHSIEFDLPNTAHNGVYLLRGRVGNRDVSHKILILR